MPLDKDWKTAKDKLNGKTKKWSNHMRDDLPRFSKGFGKELQLFEKVFAENKKSMNFFFNDLALLQGSGKNLSEIGRFLPMVIKKYKAWETTDKLWNKSYGKVLSIANAYSKEIQDSSKRHKDRDDDFHDVLKDVKKDLTKIIKDISLMQPKGSPGG